MASYHKRLKADMQAAAAAGIITPEQAAKLAELYGDPGFFGRLTAVHWIGSAAGGFIALGIILVVASNWQDIGPLAKIAAYLLLFAGTGYACTELEDKPSAAIPLELLWWFMPVIGIGLYAQVFNLSGDPVKPYLAWAALSAPLAFLSKRDMTSLLTALLLFFTLYFGAFADSGLLTLAAAHGKSAPLWHWPAALAVLGAANAAWFFRGGRANSLPLGATLAWVFFLLVSGTALQVRSSALLLLAGMSASVLWLAFDNSPARLERKLPLTVWTTAVYMMTFFWHYRPGGSEFHNPHDATAAGGAVALLLFAGALAALFLRKQPVFPEGKTEDAAAKALLAASVCCAFLMFDANEATAKLLAVIANLILVGLGAGLIMGGSRTGSEKMINRGVLVLTLLAVTRFIDLFGGLLTSGFAFIGTGLAFAFLAYAVNKGRKALIEAAKK